MHEPSHYQATFDPLTGEVYTNNSTIVEGGITGGGKYTPPSAILHNELTKLQMLKLELIRDDEEVDTAAMMKIIEEETDILSLVDSIMEEMREKEILLEGLKTEITMMTARKSRFEGKVEILKSLILMVMNRAEIQKINRPTYDAHTRATPVSLHISEESSIPAKYWKPVDPKLDRTALLADLKDEERKPREERKEIPGARLNPQGITISIKRK